MIWYGNGMNGWGYVLMTVSIVLFWSLVIIVVVALARYISRTFAHTESHSSARSTSERLLAERFARGEIDDKEYRHRLEVIRGHTSDSS